MKIGILTLWLGVDNYGQQLQIYALQKYLRNNGHDAYLIRYAYQTDILYTSEKNKLSKKVLRLLKIFNPIKLKTYIANKILLSKVSRINKENSRGFEEFRKKYVHVSEEYYKTYDEIKINPPEADAYIVGSDQVWNPACLNSNLEVGRNLMNTFFFNFGKKDMLRIGYAASWGITELPDDWKQAISPLIVKFNFIGVREKSGIKVCEDCGYKATEFHGPAQWVCDPTLLLTAEQWRCWYKQEYEENNSEEKNKYDKNTDKPYILFYYLNNGSNFNIKALYDFAKERNLEVKYVSGNSNIDKYKKIYPTNDEWLKLIDEAEYVVTDSFHGSVFSILFNKQFATMELKGKNCGMNERLNSLFELSHISPRFIKDCDTDPDFSILDCTYNAEINNGGGEILLKVLNS